MQGSLSVTGKKSAVALQVQSAETADLLIGRKLVFSFKSSTLAREPSEENGRSPPDHKC